MESQVDNNNTNCTFPLVSSGKQQHRKKAIPKEVNAFVLENYGAIYYNCWDCAEKMEILRNIELKLKTAGYDITSLEVERRLKNMKSHYRSKKKDLELGLVKSVEWEYFSLLDKIFSLSDKVDSSQSSSPAQTPKKRKAEPKSEPEELPEDLSTKRSRKVIEFNTVNDIERQIPMKPPTPPPLMSQESSGNLQLTAIHKIIESIKSVDEHRLALDQQRISLEIRRYELDVIGYQLSQLLYKLSPGQANN